MRTVEQPECFGKHREYGHMCSYCGDEFKCKTLTKANRGLETSKENGTVKPKCYSNYQIDKMYCNDHCDHSVSCSLCTTATDNVIATAPKNNLKEGKPRSSLVPWDIILKYLPPAYEEGLIKYFRESWRQGFKVSDMKDALDRHIISFYYDHEDIDPDAKKLGIDKHHLAGAMFSILSILWTLDNRPELDDRPTHKLKINNENENKEESND